MKQLYTLLLALCFTTAGAQVTIGLNEMPAAGDDPYRSRAFASPGLDYTTTGPAQTWDFSGLNITADETRSYFSVNSTNFVYALIYADLAFNPNRANHATNGVDIPFNQLLPIANPYTFFFRSSSQYRKVGYGAEIAGIPAPIIFTQQDVIYELPLDYGDQSFSTSNYQLSIPNLAFYGYSQDRSNDVDGWGTITTPAGTFDALRVHTTLAGRDSINLDNLGLGFAIPRPLVHEYKWLSPGKRVPVLQINTTDLFGLQVITNVWFWDEPRSIDVVAPLASTLCAGGEYTLTYDETGSYNVGSFLIQANNFIAELSDANGDFTNAVAIGDVTTTQSGTITITIPANTPPGTGYRIRVNASSPATTGNDSGFAITVVPGTPPVANATAGGPTTFCDGATVTLSADQDPGYTYQWLVDGNAISGATAPDLVVVAGGAYAVVVTNTCGNDQSADVAVTVDPLPVHVLDQAGYFACQGDSVTITGVDQSGLNDLAYQWSLDGNALAGATTAAIVTDVPGIYTLVITDTLSGCFYTTADGVFQTGAVPTAAIVALGDTSFCAGGSVVLEATVVDPLATYAWSLDGNAIAGANSATLTADSTGLYAVVVTSGEGCSSDPSAAVEVTENPAPPQPVITQGADTLYASGSGSFAWSLFGNPIPGAADPFIETATSGDYTVTLTDANGCTSTSNPYTYIATGLTPVVSGAPAVFPNPSEGLFTIRLPQGLSAGDQYRVLDVTGKRVLQGRLSGPESTIDLGAQDTGVYFLQLLSNGTTHTVRLVKR